MRERVSAWPGRPLFCVTIQGMWPRVHPICAPITCERPAHSPLPVSHITDPCLITLRYHPGSFSCKWLPLRFLNWLSWLKIVCALHTELVQSFFFGKLLYILTLYLFSFIFFIFTSVSMKLSLVYLHIGPKCQWSCLWLYSHNACVSPANCLPF